MVDWNGEWFLRSGAVVWGGVEHRGALLVRERRVTRIRTDISVSTADTCPPCSQTQGGAGHRGGGGAMALALPDRGPGCGPRGRRPPRRGGAPSRETEGTDLFVKQHAHHRGWAAWDGTSPDPSPISRAPPPLHPHPAPLTPPPRTTGGRTRRGGAAGGGARGG